MKENVEWKRMSAVLEQVAASHIFRDAEFMRQNLEIREHMNYALNGMAVSLVSYVLKNVKASETVTWSEYPNWFEHFKDDVFPAWLLKWFPVKANVRQAYTQQEMRVCPHLPIKIKPSEYYVHMQFLEDKP